MRLEAHQLNQHLLWRRGVRAPRPLLPLTLLLQMVGADCTRQCVCVRVWIWLRVWLSHGSHLCISVIIKLVCTDNIQIILSLMSFKLRHRTIGPCALLLLTTGSDLPLHQAGRYHDDCHSAMSWQPVLNRCTHSHVTCTLSWLPLIAWRKDGLKHFHIWKSFS